MPMNPELAMKTWARYAYCRDNGHREFVEKADICERYFAGDQWDPTDRALLQLQRRPALTINKILSTMANVMGEQIYNRAEISFRPRNGSPESIATVLSKVFKQISDNNQLDWKRSDVFADGVISSRGFYDVRIAFDDSMQGEVRIEVINPKNVVVDPDAEEYDPSTWNEVMITKWLTADDIAVLYNQEDADLLRSRATSSLPFGYDSIDRLRTRFGSGPAAAAYDSGYDESSVTRNIRVIERQYRVLDSQEHYVSMEGDMRPVPKEHSDAQKRFFVNQFGFSITKKLVRRIKWCVVADNVVLHEDWSPYKNFTVVPYFPYFRHGTTLGLVENLLGPQELLNKVSSQELHVVNTTANSGWKVKTNSLKNMSLEELEQRGATTGLVMELADTEDAEKILPNQIPSGLDRISYKAEDHIKTISGVPDSAQGFDREDVAAKAIQAKKNASQTNIAKPLDSLVRSDYFLARATLDLVQEFYTERRILTITKDKLTGETEQVSINEGTPEGAIVNDLTLGEYGVVVSSVPQRETIEDSQFEQAVSLREMGINIPDDTLIEASRLNNKRAIIQKMAAASQTPEAKVAQEAQLRTQVAEADKTEGEARQKHADADLKLAKAGKETKEANAPAEGPDQTKVIKTMADIDLQEREFEHQQQMDYAQMVEDRRQNRVEEQLKAHDDAEKRANERAAAAQAAAQPQPQGATQ